MRALLTILALGLVGSALAAEPITGRASVTDGDTVVIRDVRIRLHGIDAPESAQSCNDAAGKSYRCGQRAAFALADWIGEAPITCEPRDTDRYGRTVAVCRKGGEDLNAWMVREGHAIAYRRYSSDYVLLETEARAAKRGIWAGAFDEPAEWRRGKRAAGLENPPSTKAETQAPAMRGCAIKGNINRRGDHIYHVPGSRFYDRTVIDEASGERMFCSEAEAQAAGWREPRN
ncbi:thermonuclease family protein [Methylobacterium sp. J-026]|uniref:thermonuclease family protein n=1 Tax=Methylobacterium sp. J-026 TaxID=2836624 RepID=UPI001FBC0468|nr:thermonuclease family protein [Methylobacterium sp. J-026]MCJ2135607.1 thermonuclease family protein [Methylobacterium sp. J-026]